MITNMNTNLYILNIFSYINYSMLHDKIFLIMLTTHLHIVICELNIQSIHVIDTKYIQKLFFLYKNTPLIYSKY